MENIKLQLATSAVSGEFPDIGELTFGEIAINTTDNRLWVGDENSLPNELGGACVYSPIGDPNLCNYQYIKIETSDDLPIKTPSIELAQAGYYMSCTYLVELDLQGVVNITFDSSINWGLNSLNYKGTPAADLLANNPLQGFKTQGTKFIFTISLFGLSGLKYGILHYIGQ